MGRMYAIAINTFREAVRDRVLLGVLGCATCVLFFSLALAQLSLNQEERVVTDIGMASISLFSVIVAIFLGSSLLYKEIERRTLYVILPKPIRRWEFLVGKYFGIVLTSLVFVDIMGAIQLHVTAIQAGFSPVWVAVVLVSGFVILGVGLWKLPDPTAATIPWSMLMLGAAWFVCSQTGAEITPILASLVLSLGEVMLLGGVAMVFSSFSTPFLTGALTAGVWLVGRSADAMVKMPSRTIPLAIKKILGGLAYVIPNFNLFVPSRHTLLVDTAQYGGPWAYVGSSMGYAVLASVVLLAVASAIFQRRDFL